MSGQVALFVGTHPDDVEIACGGIIQVFRRNDILPVGLIVTGNKRDVKRRDAALKSSEILGYVPCFGEVSSAELTDTFVEECVTKLIEKYQPVVVIGHTAKDSHRSHRRVSVGTDSAARKVRNRLHFAGPEGEYEFSPNCFITYTEEEFDILLKVMEIHKEAYGDARYFHPEYLAQKSWYGQRALQYVQRENAPYVIDDGVKHLPYADGFEVRHLVNPLFNDTPFFDSELKALVRTVAGTE